MSPRISRRSQRRVSIVQRRGMRGVGSCTADVMWMVGERSGKQVICSSWAFGATQRFATYYTRLSTSL